MTSQHTKELRYLGKVPGIPLKSTLGQPYEVDGFWVVKMQCSDGIVRVFRTGPKKAKTLRREMSGPLRFEVLARDGYHCRYCGASASETPLHVDHIVPVVEGGTNELGNLITACRDCNLGKSDSTLIPGVLAPMVATPDSAEHG